jgi:hypothetical protein
LWVGDGQETCDTGKIREGCPSLVQFIPSS